MAEQNPIDTVHKLVAAINRGDLEAAIALYEPNATMVVEPGKLVSGTEAVRAALEGFIALKPTLQGEAHRLVKAGNLALSCSKWNLTGKDPGGKVVNMDGTSADVLRRQADGSWLIVIDNPWGTAILD